MSNEKQGIRTMRSVLELDAASDDDDVARAQTYRWVRAHLKNNRKAVLH